MNLTAHLPPKCLYGHFMSDESLQTDFGHCKKTQQRPDNWQRKVGERSVSSGTQFSLCSQERRKVTFIFWPSVTGWSSWITRSVFHPFSSLVSIAWTLPSSIPKEGQTQTSTLSSCSTSNTRGCNNLACKQ